MDQNESTVSSVGQGSPDHLLHNQASTQMSNLADFNNETWIEMASTSVLYYGLNGFGVTWTYFLTNMVLLVVAGIGIFLNSVALKIVSVYSPLQDAAQTFISHLAKSDLFVGVICIYTALYNLIHYKNYYECALRCGITTCLALNSSIHLLSVTVDRHFKIMYPYKYIKYFSNEKRLKFLSRCTWLLTGILGVLPILGWRRPPVNGIEYCSYFGVLDRGYLILMTGMFFGIMLMMLYCYINILYVAWNQRKRVIYPGISKGSGYDHRNTKALWWAPTKTVMILITLYSFCWMPTAVVVLLHLTNMFPASYTADQKGVIVAYVTSLVYLNIVANPLIYAFKIRRRRQSMSCGVKTNFNEPKRRTNVDSRRKDVFELSDVISATLNQ